MGKAIAERYGSFEAAAGEYLASDLAAFVSGQHLMLSGGSQTRGKALGQKEREQLSCHDPWMPPFILIPRAGVIEPREVDPLHLRQNRLERIEHGQQVRRAATPSKQQDLGRDLTVAPYRAASLAHDVDIEARGRYQLSQARVTPACRTPVHHER